MRKILFYTVAFLTVTTLLASCKSDKPTDTNRVIKVKTETVNTSSNVTPLKFVGVVEAESKTSVSFKVQGEVQSIAVQEGQYIRKGQVLAKMDTEIIEQDYNMAKSALNQAEDAYKRMKMMYDNNSLPEIKFVEVQTGLEQAKANFSLAKSQLDYAVLKSPIDGIVSQRSIEVGENLMGGQPAFSILNIKTVKVKIAVPENEIPLLSVGEKAEVIIPVLGNNPFEGNITEKGFDGNKMTHTYVVKILLDNPKHDILPGMVCNVAINQDDNEGFVLPNNCIQIGSRGDRYVWCVKDGKATAVRVTIGQLTAKGITITSGLFKGDIVIVEGMQKVSEGMNVETL